MHFFKKKLTLSFPIDTDKLSCFNLKDSNFEIELKIFLVAQKL